LNRFAFRFKQPRHAFVCTASQGICRFDFYLDFYFFFWGLGVIELLFNGWLCRDGKSGGEEGEGLLADGHPAGIIAATVADTGEVAEASVGLFTGAAFGDLGAAGEGFFAAVAVVALFARRFFAGFVDFCAFFAFSFANIEGRGFAIKTWRTVFGLDLITDAAIRAFLEISCEDLTARGFDIDGRALEITGAISDGIEAFLGFVVVEIEGGILGGFIKLELEIGGAISNGNIFGVIFFAGLGVIAEQDADERVDGFASTATLVEPLAEFLVEDFSSGFTRERCSTGADL
jgi:hypothetical protein